MLGGKRLYDYNHAYSLEKKITYLSDSWYFSYGFPLTNETVLKSKIFEQNNVRYYPSKPLEPGTNEFDFNTKHFSVSCISEGSIIIVNGLYYENNKLYGHPSWKKINDKKGTQMVNKELKEFIDKFGKHMGYQIYNPF